MKKRLASLALALVLLISAVAVLSLPVSADTAHGEQADYDEALTWAIRRGIVLEGAYDPTHLVSVDLFLHMLWLTVGMPDAPADIAVSPQATFPEAARWAASARISAAPNTRFMPVGTGAHMTRIQALFTLYLLVGQPDCGRTVHYKDTYKSAYYISALDWAYQAGLPDVRSGSFAPHAPIRSDEAVYFLYRFAMARPDLAHDATAPFKTYLVRPDYPALVMHDTPMQNVTAYLFPATAGGSVTLTVNGREVTGTETVTLTVGAGDTVFAKGGEAVLRAIMPEYKGDPLPLINWVPVGDSITDAQNYNDGTGYKSVLKYWNFIHNDTGINIPNYSTRMNHIYGRDGKTRMGMSATGYIKTSGINTEFCHRLEQLPHEADIVTIFGSVNDRTVTSNLSVKYATNCKVTVTSANNPKQYYLRAVHPENDTLADNTVAGYINAAIETAHREAPLAKIVIVPGIFDSSYNPKYTHLYVAEYNNMYKLLYDCVQGWIENKGAGDWLSYESWYWMANPEDDMVITNGNKARYYVDPTILDYNGSPDPTADNFNPNWGGTFSYSKCNPNLFALYLYNGMDADDSNEITKQLIAQAAAATDIKTAVSFVSMYNIDATDHISMMGYSAGNGFTYNRMLCHPSELYHKSYLAKKFANLICNTLDIDRSWLPNELRVDAERTDLFSMTVK